MPEQPAMTSSEPDEVVTSNRRFPLAGLTEGQLYTLGTGAVLAVVVTLAGASPIASNGLAAGLAGPLLGAGPAPTSPAPVVVAPTPDTGRLPLQLGPGVLVSPSGTPEATVPDTTGFPQPEPTSEQGLMRPVVFAKIGSPGAPGGLAFARDGALLVSTNNGTARGGSGASKVFQLNTGGTVVRTIVAQGQDVHHVNGLGATAVSPLNGSIAVVEVDAARILRFDPVTGRQSVLVTVPDVPPCQPVIGSVPCEQGIQDHQPVLTGLTFDRLGNLYIADSGQSTIWRVTSWGKHVSQWYSAPDFSNGDGPTGLAINPKGTELFFTVGNSLDTANPAAGGLYKIALGRDGAAGARSLVAKFAIGDEPGALALAPSGTVYVVLRGSGSIVKVSGAAVTSFVTSGTAIPLDGPSALAISGNALYVANEAAATPAHWAVLGFPIA